MSKTGSESGFQSSLTLTKSVSNLANGKFGLNLFKGLSRRSELGFEVTV